MAETRYVVISGGDGYAAELVPESGLDAAVLALLFDETCPGSPADHQETLDHLHHADHWVSEYPTGPARYRQDFEDGYIEVIRLTDLRGQELR